MRRSIRWAVNGTYALFVAAALSFGASQAFATTTLSSCPHLGNPEVIGECPPYDDFSCNTGCMQAGFTAGGDCFGSCCTCKM
jgi:hypothetical protein